MVRLCFTNDNDYILMRIAKMEGPTSGVVANLPSFIATTANGAIVPIAGVAGKPADEVKMIALIAFDKVKQKFGIKFGKQYKVISNDIQEMGGANAVSSPGNGMPTAS